MATKKKMKKTTAATAETVAEEKIEAVETTVEAAVEECTDGNMDEVPAEDRGDIMDEAPVADMDAVLTNEPVDVMDEDLVEDMDEDTDEDAGLVAPETGESEADAVEVEAPAEEVFGDVPMPEAGEAPATGETDTEGDTNVLTGRFMPPTVDGTAPVSVFERMKKARESNSDDNAAREERRKAMVERIRARMKSHIDKLNEARENVEASDIKEAPVPEKRDEERDAKEERRRLYAMAWAAMQNN